MSLLNGIAQVMAEDKPRFDPNSVTPGVIGFFATFIVVVIVVLLIVDMIRRVRRTQYRAEVNARLDAEQAAAAGEQAAAGDADPEASGPDERGAGS